ncbi:hypothetical protein HBH98_242930 [Parastagonospora nodorum]|nr:hypothetical protein HBH53_247930 [Parastagonospora nodorum]KAH3956395.1 hypothetical protein HBH51_242500 [Parastagonospora nodorum]KAH4215565.1 hypothetical protein HBI06_246730 [Parastagonospora nodorum]KAH4223703.1 hypothetical protein HBI05_242650 [Parastagonospora nodorum]KAH4334327.1 hypothetical protein HBH98_242930 [Parastagonospora nodorum]
MWSLCFAVSTATILLAHTVNASPRTASALEPRYAQGGDLNRLAKLMPQSALAAPNGQLKYVVLGLGTQNYTCASGIAHDAPSAAGAVATLYDIGSKLSKDSTAKLKISTISGLILSLSTHTKAVNAALELLGYSTVIGHHFFQSRDDISAPIFALDLLSEGPYPIADVLKIDAVDAPELAYPGPLGEGAVPWLYLRDIHNSSRGGINTVYRVETAGGKAPETCANQDAAFTRPYAAQYWIFGSSTEP